MENHKQVLHPENMAGKPDCLMADPKTDIESTRLLSIFPSEVWLLIFDNIFLPDDLRRIGKSSDFFHKLLQKTKTLFDEVILLLSVQLPNRVRGFARMRISQDLLSCRLVCRTWRIGVDSVLQSSSNYSKMLHVINQQSSVVLSKATDTRFGAPERAASFLQHFDEVYAAKPGNPFITRSVFIIYRNRLHLPDPVSYTNQLLQILGTYGHHIWELGLMLVFSAYPLTSTNIWSYNILRDFLQLTPNLKVLKFGCFASHRASDDEWKALELSLESCVFPELKNLRHLLMSDVPTPVYNALLRRYSHVPMFSTSGRYAATSELLMYTQPMPNLDQVAICLTNSNKLCQLDASTALWPLTTLFLKLEIHRCLPDYQQLFQFLENRWAATLTVLKLEVEEIFPEDSLRIQVLPSLNLPKLKVFSLVSSTLVPLDFILPMKNSLERLGIICYASVRGVVLESLFESEKEIKFYKFHKNIKNSNIWKLFPKLKTADCCVRFWPGPATAV